MMISGWWWGWPGFQTWCNLVRNNDKKDNGYDDANDDDDDDDDDDDNLCPKQQVPKLGKSEENSEEHDTKSSYISSTSSKSTENDDEDYDYDYDDNNTPVLVMLIIW